MPKMSGRSIDAVWDFFDRDTTHAKHPKAKCKGCSQLFGGQKARLEVHVANCAKARAMFPLRTAMLQSSYGQVTILL